MKRRRAGQGANPEPRSDRLIQERTHDPYKTRRKLPEPTACPECAAVFREGRWRWAAAPADAPRSLCPACQRIRDDYPAGFVTLAGAFLADHRDELLGLVRNVEQRAKTDHALKRIMDVREDGDTLVVTTTDLQLARAIGDALHSAYEGELSSAYAEDGAVLRVSWQR